MKTCRDCHSEKPKAEFPLRTSHGRRIPGPRCRPCERLHARACYRKYYYRTDHPRSRLTEKFCPGCKAVLPKEQFVRKGNAAGGRCRPCYRIQQNGYLAAHPDARRSERFRKKQKAYRQRKAEAQASTKAQERTERAAARAAASAAARALIVAERERERLRVAKARADEARARAEAQAAAHPKHPCEGGCGAQLTSRFRFCMTCKIRERDIREGSSQRAMRKVRVRRRKTSRHPQMFTDSDEPWSLVDRCHDCKKAILRGPRCYQCATGRPRMIVRPEERHTMMLAPDDPDEVAA